MVATWSRNARPLIQLGQDLSEDRAQRLHFAIAELVEDECLAGQGVGGQLVRVALDRVRSLGVLVLPICPLVGSWMDRHPDYVDQDHCQPPRRVTD